MDSLAVLSIDLLVNGQSQVEQQLVNLKKNADQASASIEKAAKTKPPPTTLGQSVMEKSLSGLNFDAKNLTPDKVPWDKLAGSIGGAAGELGALGGVGLASLGPILAATGPIAAGFVVVAGAIAMAVAGVKNFIEDQDKLKVLGERVRLQGGNPEQAKGRLEEFSERMRDRGQSQEVTLGQVEAALARGLTLDQAMLTANAAKSLATQLNMSSDAASNLLRRYQEMGPLALRREESFRAMIKEGASEAEIQAKLNDLIAKGAELGKFKRENTIAGQASKMGIAWERLVEMTGELIGPAVVAALQLTSAIILDIVDGVTTWKKENADLWEGLMLVSAGVGYAIGGIVYAIGYVIGALVKAVALITKFLGIILGIRALGEWWSGPKTADNAAAENAKALGASLEPGGQGKKSTFMNAEELWKKLAIAGVEGGPNYQQQSAQGIDRLNQTMNEWSVSGLPTRNVGEPAQVRPR